MATRKVELKERENCRFEVVCDEEFLPVTVAQTMIDEVVDRVQAVTFDALMSDQAKEALKDVYDDLRHYKFWNKVLFVTIIVLTLYFAFWR